MALNNGKGKARLDFSDMILNEISEPTRTENPEPAKETEPIKKATPVSEPKSLQTDQPPVTEKKEKKEPSPVKEKKQKTTNEFAQKFQRPNSGHGKQKSVYIEEDNYTFIMKIVEESNGKFSQILNELVRIGIQSVEK